MSYERAIDSGELVAAFIRARFATRCAGCGGRIAKGEMIHWMKDVRGTVVNHAGNCPVPVVVAR